MPLLSTIGGASIRGFMGLASPFKSYTLLADTTVGTATTTVDLTGLNLGVGDEILISVHAVSSTQNPAWVIYFNGTYTNTSYITQQLTADGTSNYATRLTSNSTVLTCMAIAPTFAFIKVKLTNSGYIVWQSESEQYVGYNSGGSGIQKNYGTTTFTASSITSIRFREDSATNNISVGSRIQLYKINP
jgi:hypothetical protein